MKKILSTLVITLTAGLLYGDVIKEWGFNTNGDAEGWEGSTITGMTVANGYLSGTAATTDVHLYNIAARTGNVDMPTDGFSTIQFRIREKSVGGPNNGNYITSFAEIGLYGGFGGIGYLGDGSRLVSAVDDGGGFFVVTWDFSDVTADPALFARLDPIGGADSGSNTFDLDWVRVNGVVPEPATMGMLGLGALITMLIRRYRL